MKNLKIFIIATALAFFSCEKVVDIEVPSIAPKLVIDANFNVFFDETPVTANTDIKLSLSADYFDIEIPAVADATVFVTNTTDNTIITYNHSNNGTYSAINAFIPEDNVSYELTVIYNGQTYKGNATKIKSTPFIDAFQGDETLFSGEEIEVKVSFKDDENAENYYLFNFTNNLYLTIEDRFFNGTDYNFSFFYEEDDIELPTNATIQMAGISKDYYTYFRILSTQSGQSGGGPFEAVPSALLGNIVNTTDDANYPLGYFHISETDTFNLDLIEK